ncbi:superoxide dismutase [Caerostris extrusa]|uniref:Superoxide dismutase [Cu-Zn] n=1 Tax=Caerostris extrusa TaxID=172846 RepID=A0AAV4QDJ9_CAEEX|nr:superoxide dismutase [Caerostris extrusa]
MAQSKHLDRNLFSRFPPSIYSIRKEGGGRWSSSWAKVSCVTGGRSLRTNSSIIAYTSPTIHTARYLYWSRGAPCFISNMSLLVFSCVILLSGALGVRAAQPIAPRQNLSDCERAAAVCRLHNGTVTATINFKRERVTAPVTVSGEISGLSQGLHGFHVHQYGDLSQGCVSAGPHFNPYGRNHGAPDVEERHVGDLGNIQAGADGVARFQIVDHQLRLCGPLSIMGRAIVVHAMQDDLGRGGNEESLKTGNAGARLGCCVIGQASL